MKRLNALRPSPAMIVAIVALVAALGGSAYAANKIGTNQIKANAITAGKIKKEAVTGSKIKNGAVTGSKIDLSSVGTVPSATHASTADSATKANEATKATEAVKAGEAATAKSAETAKTAGTAKSAETAEVAEYAEEFSRYFTTGLVKASIGEEVVLEKIGAFTLTGFCEESGGETVSGVYLTTTEPKSNAYSYEYEGPYHENFEPGDELQVDYGAKSAGPEVAFFGSHYGFTAESHDGSLLISGEAGSAVNTFGANCAFEVNGTINS